MSNSYYKRSPEPVVSIRNKNNVASVLAAFSPSVNLPVENTFAASGSKA
ncbi:hypothetical protein [Erwinia sp. B116]|nr:hypothetical protein [Erwinia sp. B116]